MKGCSHICEGCGERSLLANKLCPFDAGADSPSYSQSEPSKSEAGGG